MLLYSFLLEVIDGCFQAMAQTVAWFSLHLTLLILYFVSLQLNFQPPYLTIASQSTVLY